MLLKTDKKTEAERREKETPDFCFTTSCLEELWKLFGKCENAIFTSVFLAADNFSCP